MDDDDNWITVEGLKWLQQGLTAVDTSRKLLAQRAEIEAEVEARRGLELLRSAMDWLENTDDDLFDQAHRSLDQAGQFTRTTFGCRLHRDGTSYQQRCPVALAHNRVGFSVALLIKKSECSICHTDPAQCPHVTGRLYDGERCVRELKEFDILDVSLVGRPAQPDARILAISISNADLQAELGADFEPGIEVNCDRCLAPCAGIMRPFG